MLLPLAEHGAAVSVAVAAAAVAAAAGIIILPLSRLTGGAVVSTWDQTQEMVSLLGHSNICMYGRSNNEGPWPLTHCFALPPHPALIQMQVLRLL